MTKFLALTTIALALVTTTAQAQNNGGSLNPGQIQKCLSMAANADLLNEVNRRMSYGQQPVYPAPSSGYSCLVIDSGYSRTFVGKGGTKLQAEAAAKTSCSKSVNSTYCDSAVRCAQPERGTRGHFCIVTDTGYSRTFSSEGTDIIDAEAKAKMACQESVNSTYCGNAPVKCEPIY